MDRKKDTDPRMGGMKPKSRAKGADKKCPGVQKKTNIRFEHREKPRNRRRKLG